MSEGGAWVMLPAIGAALVHGPVMSVDVLPGLKQPLDGGRTFRGRPIFGANKTLRGALFMSGGTLAAAVALTRMRWLREKLPDELLRGGGVPYGAALGFAVVAGELPNSFVKRQLDIAPGGRRWTPAGAALVVFDQADFVPFAALTLRPLWRMPPRDVAVAFAFVAAIHSGINLIGYAIGARDTWI